ncbi:MAG: DUF4132 domain-containing protein [Tannerellaceae bacterium]|jgi:hypothetical protein|nr:DUF4132 domain-containing protein [Tannerellaceae bacterium]
MQLFVNPVQAIELKSLDPSAATEVLSLPVVEADIDFNIKRTFPLLQTPLFNKLLGHSLPSAYTLFERLNALIARHASYEYTSTSGLACVLGNSFPGVQGAEGNRKRLDRYPLPHVWRDFYRREIVNFPTMLQLIFALSTHWGEGQSYKVYEFMYKEFISEIKKFYGFDLYGLKVALAKLPHLNVINTLMPLLAEEYWDAAYANSVAENILASFIPLLDKGHARKEFMHETYMKKEQRTVFLHQHSSISYWMTDSFGGKQSRTAFTSYFMLRYQYYRKSGYLTTQPPAALPKGPLSVFDFGYAYELGLIPESELLKELLTRVNAEDSLSLASSFLGGTLKPWQRNKLKAYGGTDLAPLKEMVKNILAYILSIELKRGEPITEVSHLAMKLERIEGAEVWVALLEAFDKDTFGRVDYYYNSNYSRKEVLSRLLLVCYPSDTDTAATLSPLVKQADISHERLIEAAIYAPQWLDIVEEYTGWKGLKSAACFFHAHSNERCDERLKATIAHFTPVDPEDLRSGALDIGWFHEACRNLGNRRFEKVYSAARYITPAAEYTRLSRFLDAVNGKIDLKEVRKQVEEKRNRDLLMIYCLIPLSKRSGNDLPERYRYLHQFLKESKDFGSQRQESEKKAVELGMRNLAQNAGYPNVNHLIWSMETRSFKQIEPCFVPHEKEGVKVYIKVNRAGKTGIHFFKAGKELNNIPGKLRKDPYVVRLKEVNKRMKNLFAHSEAMLEQAMEERTPFLVSELKAFRKHPLISPLLKHLVFISHEGVMGFCTDEGLLSSNGSLVALEPADELRLAHPLDLHSRQEEAYYREYLNNKGIEQPFEQVFRKVYDKTEEEQSLLCPLRHAGDRILPGRMASVLKERRWVATGEEQWQKVFYVEDAVAVISVLSHSLSPADMEASTLEQIAFFGRKSFHPLPVAEVPDSVFSEVMRDIGLLQT